MFRGMFSIPQGLDITVLDPIPLSEDSAEEFRAISFSSPNEIHRQTTRDANVQRLMDVARMCHKYNLPAFETWALDMIRIQCQQPLHHLAACPQEVLDRLMNLATLCSDAQLLGLVEGAWISRLQSRGLPQVAGQNHPEIDCSAALAAGEKYDQRKFQGDVYYELNRQITAESSTLSTTRRFSHLQLTDQQLIRLLSGCVLLASFWGKLRNDPLPVAQGQCNAHYHCTNSWAQIPWSLDSSNLLEHLKSFRNSYNSRKCVTNRLDDLLSTFTTGSVADYFLGPEVI